MVFPKLIPGRFIQRDNRFRATVSVQGQEAWAHVPNSGRLQELFQPGRPVWLAPAAAAHRKTGYDLKLVEYASVLVSMDARLPNPLLAEALAKKKLPGDRHCRRDTGGALMTQDWRRRTADGRQPPDFRPARAGGTESSQWVTAHGRVSPDSSSGESEF
jgi:hypothetical protein